MFTPLARSWGEGSLIRGVRLPKSLSASSTAPGVEPARSRVDSHNGQLRHQGSARGVMRILRSSHQGL